MPPTIQEHLVLLRGDTTPRNPVYAHLPEATSVLHVSEAEHDQITYSASCMLTHFAVKMVGAAKTFQAAADVAQTEGMAPEEVASPSSPPTTEEAHVSTDARQAAAQALQTATLSELFSAPPPTSGASSPPTHARSTSRTALEVLEDDMRSLFRHPEVLKEVVSDVEAVRFFFHPSTCDAPAVLSASSRATLIFAALWLSLKFWTRTRLSVSLNRILFDCMEAHSTDVLLAKSASAGCASDNSGQGQPVVQSSSERADGLQRNIFSMEKSSGAATPPAPPCEPVLLQDALRLNGSVTFQGAVGADAMTAPSPVSVDPGLRTDVLVLQPSQWSAPRGVGAAAAVSGAMATGGGGSFDAIGHVLHGVEAFEMVLLRCSHYMVPLPSS